MSPAAPPAAPTAADPISVIEHRVNYSETDQMTFAYHANYLVWFDMARTEYLRGAIDDGVRRSRTIQTVAALALVGTSLALALSLAIHSALVHIRL